MKKIKWLKLTLLSLFIGIIAVISIYVYSIIKFTHSISTGSTSQSSVSQSDEGTDKSIPKWEGKDRINILILGGDARGENDAGRSDSIMLLSLDPVSKKAHLFSILRDTYVEIPGHGKGRLNSSFSYGGIELTRQTVSNLLGIPIHNYLYTDFEGFISLVDALGGVDINVEKDMYYTSQADHHLYDINLKKGMQHMDGKTALQYVRFRHDATSDFSRTERQRNFLSQVARKMRSTSSLIKIPSILDSMAPYIQTDLSPNQMLKLVSLGFDIDVNGMDKQQIPPYSLLKNQMVGKAQVLGVDPFQIQKYVQDLFDKDRNSSK